jgi:hypothetical protein
MEKHYIKYMIKEDLDGEEGIDFIYNSRKEAEADIRDIPEATVVKVEITVVTLDLET